MGSQPTFNQIVYTPDLGECLTIEQATNLLDRARPGVEALARRIVEELARQQLRPADRARSLSMWTADEVVASHGRSRNPDWICVGTVDFRAAYAGSAMSIALQWWWLDDGLRVGWTQVRPEPTWDR